MRPKNCANKYPSKVVLAVVLGWGLLPWVALAVGREDNGSLQRRVLSEYPQALKVLKVRFAAREGILNYTSSGGNNARDPHLRPATFSFAVKRPRMAKVVRESSIGGSKKQSVTCYNSDYAFQLSKESPDGKYSVRNLHRRESLDDRTLFNSLRINLDAPFKLGFVDMADLMGRQGFTISGVSPLVRGGNKVLKIAFEAPLPVSKRNDGGGYIGWIIVAPDNKWVTLEYEYRPRKGKVVWTGTIDYDGIQEGFPLPKRVIHIAAMQENRKDRMVETSEFEKVSFLSNVPDHQFTLAAFGIPETVVASRSTRGSGVALWLVGLSLCSLILAAILRKLAVSHSETGQSPG